MDGESWGGVIRGANLLPLDQIEEEFWDIRSADKGSSRQLDVAEHFSQGQGDLDDETGNTFEEEYGDGHLGQNAGIFQSPDFWFVEDAEVVFGG